MRTGSFLTSLSGIFTEITSGASVNGAIVLNGGDPGLLASLDKLSAEEASIASHQGTTVAAHAEHVRYGLLLMNTWAKQGGNPFAHARWQDAWKIITVDEPRWQEIRDGLRSEVLLWQEALRTPRDVAEVELSGMIGSVAHTAYHLGAIRQIVAGARGPKDPSPK